MSDERAVAPRREPMARDASSAPESPTRDAIDRTADEFEKGGTTDIGGTGALCVLGTLDPRELALLATLGC